MSTGDEASRFARFAFRRHFFQHLGFRVARNVTETKQLPIRTVTNEVFVLGAGVNGGYIAFHFSTCNKCVLNA